MSKHYDNLLLDGKNTAYRSLFAGHADPSFRQSGYDYFVVFLRFLNRYVNQFHPKSVHVFWDAPSSSLWRREVYPEYKIQRDGMYDKYDFDVKAELRRQMAISLETLNVMNVRQYYRDGQEADDLIYAFVKANEDKSNLIVSGDGDFKQIIYHHNGVDLYNPNTKTIEQKPTTDPIIWKALIGDTSDNIDGYNQIGKARAKPLVENPVLLKNFLASDKANILKDGQKVVVGDQIFNRNVKIIDLSQCPSLDENIEYIRHHQSSKVAADISKVAEIARRRKVSGLMNEMPTAITSFQRLT